LNPAVRVLVLLLLAAPAVRAHGGTFRPPPSLPARDPGSPGGGLSPTTVRTQARALEPWEHWWQLNRARYLRLRGRMLERVVTTGPAPPRDFVDRRALRDHVAGPEILAALRDADAEVRIAAAIAAARLKMSEAAPALRELFAKDPDRRVRDAALFGLAFLRDPALAPFLKGVALDADAPRHLRGFAVLGLGHLDQASLLRSLLDGEGVKGSGAAVDEVRACAAVALGLMGADPGALARVALDADAPRDVRGLAAGAIGRTGSALAAPEVIGLLRDRDALDLARCGAAISVGSLVQPGDGVVEFLGRVAQRDKHGGLRALLFLSLGRIGGPPACAAIATEMRETREQTMRGFCYLALGISDADDAGPQLLEALGKRKNFSERAACALALGLCGYGEAAGILREQVAKGQPGASAHSLVALGLLDDREAIPLARAALGADDDPALVGEAALALALLRRNAATDELVARLSTAKSSVVLNAVAHALGEVGTERAAAPLVALLRDRQRSGPERAAALAALARIAEEDELSFFARYAFDYNIYCVSETLELLATIL